MSLDGQVAVVTGGASGIGAAVAAGLAGDGATVEIFDLENGVDVSDEQSVSDACEGVVGRHGRIDVLVNNAGHTSIAPLLEMTEAEWDRELDVALKGAFLVSQAVARVMVGQGSGRIACLASTAAESARVGGASHCAAKAGVAMLVKVMALELGPRGITVNAVAPGLVPTPAERTTEEYREAFRRMNPVGRLGRAEDVAAAIGFLVSDEAAFVNGAVLPVDGGFLAGRPLPAQRAL